jgi:polysaccharide export outer membrane protein
VRTLNRLIGKPCYFCLAIALLAPVGAWGQSFGIPAPYKGGNAPQASPSSTPLNPGVRETPKARISMPVAAPMPQAGPIGIGDLLEVSVFDTPELNSRARVADSGNVSLPLVGELHLLGLSPREAELATRAALIDKGFMKDPQVSVFVLEYAAQDVTVIGEVVKPGIYPFTVHHQLLDLLSAASGLTPTASRTLTVYHRDQPDSAHTLTISLDPAGASGVNPQLLPGDTILVGRAGIVYVLGEVLRPGGFPMDPNEKVTALKALALAWGESKTAALGSARLIRKDGSGYKEIALNLKNILSGKSADPELEDQDILYVPGSAARNAMHRSLDAIVQTAVGVTIYSQRL